MTTASSEPKRAARVEIEPPRSRSSRALRTTGDYLRRIYDKAGEDNVFYMAGAIAFNILVAFVPLCLAVIGIAGMILRKQSGNAPQVLLNFILKMLPPVGAEFQRGLSDAIHSLLEKSSSFVGVGSLFLVWFATRLFGTLRTTVCAIFDIPQDRGIIEGKIFDVKMVFTAGALFAFNIGLTLGLAFAATRGMNALGLTPLTGTVQVVGSILAFISVWVMFLLIYRYLPSRMIQWRTCLVAATFAAIFFEVLKQAFGWYVSSVADYKSTYGNLTTLIILFLYLYYIGIVFVLGGEIAQVDAIVRIRRQQKERIT